MWDDLLWLYMINATLLIVHEMDSAYWKEWNLFKLPKFLGGGICGFLLIHIPLVFIILWGLLEISRHTMSGLIISFVVGFCGLFAFCIHRYFIRKGHPEFNTAVSRSILLAVLLASLAQMCVGLIIL